jgi:serine/threonine protein kinase
MRSDAPTSKPSEPPTPRTPPLSIGSTFHDRYTVVRAIKSGSQGAIYEVIDHTSRARALKVLHASLVSDACQRERFRLEAVVTAGIRSDHLVEVFDVGVDADSGRPFILMELLEGEELLEMVKRRGPLPAGEVLVFLAQAAVAIEKAHAAGVIHRDLKPANLFLTYADDGSPRLKVIDFGLAKAASSHGKQDLSMTGAESLGTPLYMAPEQIRDAGRVGPAVDLYALAHVAYTLLVGTSYWTDESEAEGVWSILLKASHGAPEPAGLRAARRGVALPPAFDAWFAKATAVLPEDRFDRPSTMIAALADVFGPKGPRVDSSDDLEPAAWSSATGQETGGVRAGDARERVRRWAPLFAGVLAVIGVASLSGSRMIEPALPALAAELRPTQTLSAMSLARAQEPAPEIEAIAATKEAAIVPPRIMPQRQVEIAVGKRQVRTAAKPVAHHRNDRLGF